MINIDLTWKRMCLGYDEQTFGHFFDYFYPKLLNLSLRYVKESSAAEEVVSDVFFKLLKDRDQHKDISQIKPYLYQSVKNKSLNWLRDQRKNIKMDNIEQVKDFATGEPEELIFFSGDEEIFQILEGKIQQLPTRRQMVYRLLREDGWLIGEVAESLSLSSRTVEKHLELATKELCKDLKEYLKNQRQHPKIRKIFPRALQFNRDFKR